MVIIRPFISALLINQSVNCSFFLFQDFPRFTQPIENVSAPIDRDAVLNCHVDGADNFMVKIFINLSSCCLVLFYESSCRINILRAKLSFQ